MRPEVHEVLSQPQRRTYHSAASFSDLSQDREAATAHRGFKMTPIARCAGAALTAFLLLPSVLLADPVAIVASVRGKVEVTPARTKAAQRAAFGRPLERGDRVAVPGGGAATLFFNDGNVIEMSEKSTITIGGSEGLSAKRELSKAIFTQVSGFVTGGSRETGLVALSRMRRADANEPFLIAPRKTAVLDTRPVFSWRAVEGARRYVVSLFGDGKEIWKREVQETTLVTPAELPPLVAGADYSWEVEARSDSAGLGSEIAAFYVLPADAATSVRASLSRIDESLGAATPAAGYVAGCLLSEEGLYQEAIARFEDLCRLSPDSPDAHEALGGAYARVGMLDRATAEFQRALALSRTP